MRHSIPRPDEDPAPAQSSLQEILSNAQDVDLEFIVGILKSPLGFNADPVMDAALEAYYRERSLDAKQALTRILEHELRYAGSSDVAYLFRWIRSDDAGVRPERLLSDVAAKLNVNIRKVGTFEAKLQRVVRAVVEKELFAMTPTAQRELIASQGVSIGKTDEFIRHLKQKGPVAAVPLLMTIAGREAAEKIGTALVVRLITVILGRHAAEHLIKSLAARFPWWADWIGPVGWAVTGAWVAVDLQGPAYRKTIPAILYLGLLTLRGQADHGDLFYEHR